jgi:phosphoadenosine phosphosulfate reductase
MSLNKLSEELNNYIDNLDTVEALRFIAGKFKNKTVFTTSFGYEDQVITDMILKNNIEIDIVTLDTGRLFKETYKVFSQTLDVYNKKIKVFYPNTKSVEDMVTEKGPYSFYNSVDDRIECCNIRKVEPLNRALQGVECWVTGIRAEQSSNREDMTFFEVDKSRNILKFNPLLKFTFDDVKEYIKNNNVPYNTLHNENFVSIGCEPCTRATKPGEDFRAGRWWWENNSKKECGLHTH